MRDTIELILCLLFMTIVMIAFIFSTTACTFNRNAEFIKIEANGNTVPVQVIP
jgi:uncharacterized protein YxeA